jgi:hypothetical protein
MDRDTESMFYRSAVQKAGLMIETACRLPESEVTAARLVAALLMLRDGASARAKAANAGNTMKEGDLIGMARLVATLAGSFDPVEVHAARAHGDYLETIAPMLAPSEWMRGGGDNVRDCLASLDLIEKYRAIVLPLVPTTPDD